MFADITGDDVVDDHAALSRTPLKVSSGSLAASSISNAKAVLVPKDAIDELFDGIVTQNGAAQADRDDEAKDLPGKKKKKKIPADLGVILSAVAATKMTAGSNSKRGATK